VTTVRRISKFRKDVCCVKGGDGVLLKILHSINITYFAHPVQKCARDCYLSYGSNVLPNGYSTSVHTFVQVAHRWNFVKNYLSSKITLEKSTAHYALFVM